MNTTNKVEIISKCGFRCDLCLAYNKNLLSNEVRERLKYGWKKYFNIDIDATKLYCDGCLGNDKNLKTVDSGCPVRPCAIEKGYSTCAECPDYLCNELKTRACAYIPVLEKIKAEIPEDDYNDFIRPYEGKKNLDAIRNKMS